MINTSIVTSELLGLVGFRQPFNPDLPTLTAQNLTSRSGLIVNESPMAKLEYLYDSQDYKDISDSDFNTFLENKQKESIINVCNSVFNKSSYIDRQIFYKNAFNKINTETLPSGFIGFKLDITSQKNVAFRISRVLLDFEGAGDIELLLFNTSKKAPIQSKVITISTDHQVEKLDWIIDNTDTTYKGEYYLGYLSDYIDIGTLKPYKRDYEAGNVLSNVTYLNIEEGVFSGMTTNVLPDLNNWDGTDLSSGVNPDVTIYEDFTDLVVNNEFLFAQCIVYDMQINILSEIANSIRANRNTRIGEKGLIRILQEIEGQNQEGAVKITGLRPQLYKATKVLSKEIENLQKGYFGDPHKITTMI